MDNRATTSPAAVHEAGQVSAPEDKPNNAGVVQGVPVQAAPPPSYYQQQQWGSTGRPAYGIGSYSNQSTNQGGPYGAPYNPHEPQSFEVHEVHPAQPLPCLCGLQLVLFAVGWIFPVCWYVGAFWPLCSRRIDPREKLGWLINSVSASIFTIIIILVIAKYHYSSWNTVNGPY